MRALWTGLIIGAPLGLVLFFAWHYWDVRRGTDIDALDATVDALHAHCPFPASWCEDWASPEDAIYELPADCESGPRTFSGPSEPLAPAPAPGGPEPL